MPGAAHLCLPPLLQLRQARLLCCDLLPLLALGLFSAVAIHPVFAAQPEPGAAAGDEPPAIGRQDDEGPSPMGWHGQRWAMRHGPDVVAHVSGSEPPASMGWRWVSTASLPISLSQTPRPSARAGATSAASATARSDEKRTRSAASCATSSGTRWASGRASPEDGAAAVSPEEPGCVYDAHERRVAAIERTFESFESMVEGLAARSCGKGPLSE